jgi:hypothetical protein
MVVRLSINDIHCARNLIMGRISCCNQQNTTVETYVHLTYVLNGVIQVTVMSEHLSVEAATTRTLVVEADMF